MDGTLWCDDEMIRAGRRQQDRAAHGACQHERAGGAIERARRTLPVGRKVFIHINNTNPALLADSPERAALERAGWEVAHDGMELSL